MALLLYERWFNPKASHGFGSIELDSNHPPLYNSNGQPWVQRRGKLILKEPGRIWARNADLVSDEGFVTMDLGVTDVCIRFNTYLNLGNYDRLMAIISRFNPVDDTFMLVQVGAGYKPQFYYFNGSSYSLITSGPGTYTDKWLQLEYRVSGNSHSFWVDGNLEMSSYSYSINPTSTHFGIRAYSAISSSDDGHCGGLFAAWENNGDDFIDVYKQSITTTKKTIIVD